MEVVGGGSVVEYGHRDEIAHESSDNEFWQESVVAFWWDTDNKIGGYHRIGHEPNYRDGPSISLWNNIFTQEFIYKDACTLSLRIEDRLSNGFGAGDTCRFEFTDHAIWTVNAPEVRADIHIHDLHTPVDVYPKKGAVGDDFSPNHMEVAGKVSGTLDVKGKHYQIKGLAFRDHGWGKRDWSVIVSHRWIAATFENGTMVLMHTFHAQNNEFVQFGCLIRDNKLTYAKDLDILTFVEADGLTHRGGCATMTLVTGEVMNFDFAPLQKGVVSWMHGISCVDTFCKVTCGHLTGLADFETTNNAMRGGYRPYFAINAIEKNGLHKIEG